MRQTILPLFILSLLILTSCAHVAKSNDTVTFDYTLRLENGTIVDTSLVAIAHEAGIYDAKKTYKPLTATLGDGQIIRGLEEEIPGMKVGETKTITIQPIEAYGQYSHAKVVTMPLDKTESLYRTINNRGQNASVGQPVKITGVPWPSVVTNITPTTITIKQEPANNSLVETSIGPARITIANDEVTAHLLLKKGGALNMTEGMGRVISVNETDAVLDFNHPLAGKPLVFTITLLSTTSA